MLDTRFTTEELEKLRSHLALLTSYYNDDKGSDLKPVQLEPYRAVCANVAYCLVDKERYQKYAESSDYWKTKLKTAARNLATDTKLVCCSPLDDGSEMELRNKLANHLRDEHTLKALYQNPCRLDYRLDMGTVFVILREAMEGYKPC